MNKAGSNARARQKKAQSHKPSKPAAIPSFRDQVMEGLTELERVLKSGEPLEDHFIITTRHVDASGKLIRTVIDKRKKR